MSHRLDGLILLLATIGLIMATQQGKSQEHSAPGEIEIPERKPAKLTKTTKTAVKEDVWSAEQIAKAKATCTKLFASRKLTFEPLKPIKKGVCGDPAPVKLTAVGAGTTQVKIIPPATVNCDMAAKIADWFENHVQPEAKKTVKADIAAIKNVASYACRRRYGNPKKRMSEHAFANALDIAAFKISGGKVITLVKDWGISKRELKIREKEKRQSLVKKKTKELMEKKAKEEAAKKAERENKKKEAQKTPVMSPKPYKGDREDIASKKTPTARQIGKEAKQKTAPKTSTKKLTKTKPDIPDAIKKQAHAWAAKQKIDLKTKKEIAQENDPKRIFLRNIYKNACALFGTVLSPEANKAHRDHFHLDAARYRKGSYCQ